MPSREIQRLLNEEDLGVMHAEQAEYPSFRLILDYASVPAIKDARGTPQPPLAVLKSLLSDLGLSATANTGASTKAGKIVVNVTGEYKPNGAAEAARVSGQAELRSNLA